MGPVKEAIRTDQAIRPLAFYSQGIKAGGFLFISGQLPLDLEGNLVGPGMREQAQRTLENVAAILVAAGGKLDDLVNITLFITDLAQWPDANAVYQQFLAGVFAPPARSVAPVTQLPKGCLIEIQATAWLG